MRFQLQCIAFLAICQFAVADSSEENKTLKLERPHFKVAIAYENVPNDGTPSIESYINREFRDINDVSIVGIKEADYLLSIGVIPIKNDFGNLITYVIKYTLFDRPFVFGSLYKGQNLEDIPDGMWERVSAATKDSGAWSIVFVGHAYGNNEAIKGRCEEIVAKIDLDLFEAKRKETQAMIDSGLYAYRDE
ncbi:MAG: hypothetical protein RLZZ303_3241 [Candidatus Hydrogenedentota bacterium]